MILSDNVIWFPLYLTLIQHKADPLKYRLKDFFAALILDGSINLKVSEVNERHRT